MKEHFNFLNTLLSELVHLCINAIISLLPLYDKNHLFKTLKNTSSILHYYN